LNPYTDIFDAFLDKVKQGEFYEDVYNTFKKSKKFQKGKQPIFRKVSWEKLEIELMNLLNERSPVEPKILIKVKDEFIAEINTQNEEQEKAMKKERLNRLHERNKQPILQGRWRKEAYAPRKYETLTDYVFTNSIPVEAANDLQHQLQTPLDGFLGPAYNYDDNVLTEEWMITFNDGTTNKPSENDIIRFQIEGLVDIIITIVINLNI
jgi:hypothetical protein